MDVDLLLLLPCESAALALAAVCSVRPAAHVGAYFHLGMGCGWSQRLRPEHLHKRRLRAVLCVARQRRHVALCAPDGQVLGHQYPNAPSSRLRRGKRFGRRRRWFWRPCWQVTGVTGSRRTCTDKGPIAAPLRPIKYRFVPIDALMRPQCDLDPICRMPGCAVLTRG